jgi:RNA polymerase sigma factor for flagellar operon FliA
MGIPVDDVGKLRQLRNRASTLSLGYVLGSDKDEGGLNVVDLIADENSTTSKELEAREMHRILEEGVDRLQEDERRVVALFFLNGLTYAEISKVMGVSCCRVRKLLEEALNSLRSHMKAVFGRI